MRIIYPLIALAAVASPAVAHDFWLQPRGFQFDTPTRLPLIMLVGHGKARERWGVGPDHVVQFRSFGPDGAVDRVPALAMGGPASDAVVAFDKPGSYVLAFQSTQSASTLPYLRFNEYLTTEGLTPALAARKRAGTDKSDGRETYSRRAKVIVQIGPVAGPSAALVTRPTGLSLEIVPEKHPYALKKGEALPIRVYFEGRPVSGALVKLTNLDYDTRALETHLTDRSGRTRFAVPQRGSWLLNVVWTKPIRDPKADFQTTFSSLTFGY